MSDTQPPDPTWLRRASFVEGISALLLFFVAMPLKYGFGMPEAVRVIGMAHGLLFVAFIVFSPTGLVGLYERATARWRKSVEDDAAMALRLPGLVTLPDFLQPPRGGPEEVLVATGLAKSFGGIQAIKNMSLRLRDRKLHALIGPNGAGKTSAFNLISGLFAPDRGTITLGGQAIAGLAPEQVTQAGIGRSFQITNLFATLSVAENVRLAIQARHPKRFALWADAASLHDVNRDAAEVVRTMGLAGVEQAQAASLSYGGQRLLARLDAGGRIARHAHFRDVATAMHEQQPELIHRVGSEEARGEDLPRATFDLDRAAGHRQGTSSCV